VQLPSARHEDAGLEMIVHCVGEKTSGATWESRWHLVVAKCRVGRALLDLVTRALRRLCQRFQQGWHEKLMETPIENG